MFEKSLADLIRGIRSHSDDEARYISSCMDDCRKELMNASLDTKSNAVAKLTYLQMLGYDVSWAAFHMVEVMSSKKFTHKRIGYLAASQTFHEGTDVLMLTTNMIKKDMASQNVYESGIALNGLSNFMTTDLARDLANDIVAMLTSVRPYVRKKATLITYKVFLKFPDALRPTFSRLKDKLEDTEPSVQSAAVNVICELARKNPKNYLSLAPIFFKLLTSSQNNWMRIKIIKLFAALTPLEPRLGKKLIEPLTNLIHSTPAMSLLYECIMTVVAGIPDHIPSIQLCVQKLRIFVEDSDQNLKYLGLQALAEVLKIHPKAVTPHRDLIISCLDDLDESIRLRALNLLSGMVNKKNLVDIVRKLLVHLESSDGTHYRDEVVSKIVEICSQNHYAFITNFEWYIQVLVQLTRVENTRHGKLIASQLLDVAIRVKSIRSVATVQNAALLNNPHLMQGSTEKNGICEVLYAAAWVTGEFAEFIKEPLPILDALLQPRVASLPGHIQSVYLHNTIKLYSRMSTKAEPDVVDQLRTLMIQRIPLFTQSGDLEVQERAISILEVMKYIQKKRDQDVNLDAELQVLFQGDLNPVASKAQRKVPVPEGLDLDKWINEPESSDEEEEMDTSAGELFGSIDYSQFETSLTVTPKVEEQEEEESVLEARKEARRASIAANPYHLGGGQAPSLSTKESSTSLDVEDYPVTTLDVDIPITFDVPDPTSSTKKLSKKERKRLKKKGLLPKEEEAPVVAIDTVAEMPEGALESDNDDDDELPLGDPHAALNVDLDAPLDVNEVLPVAQHRQTNENFDDEESTTPKKKKKKEKSKKEDKHKKKKKHKSKHGEASLVDTGDVAVAAAPAAAEAPLADIGDLDFWLSDKPEGSKQPEAAAAPVAAAVLATEESPEVAADAAPKKEKSHKSKKPKKEKKSKKSKKSQHVEGNSLIEMDNEPAPGATSPNGEVLSSSNPGTPATTYKSLAVDEQVRITFDTACILGVGNQVCVSLLFSNLSDDAISKLQLDVMESMNAKIEGADKNGGSFELPFELAPSVTNEFRITITAQSIDMPQKLRGSLTYMAGKPGEVVQNKLDFKLPLPCSAFVRPASLSHDEFAALLGGGTLCPPQSLANLPMSGQTVEAIVGRVCRLLHLGFVEAAAGSASLYGEATDGKAIAMLVKTSNDTFGIDTKATDSNFLGNLVAELRAEFN